MAEYNNIIAKDRQRLEDVLPIKTPYSLCIDPSNICNFKCNFCAIQKKEVFLPFKRQVMDFELYKKIIDDISMFEEPLKVLRLNGNGEPLINQYFPDMVAYAKEKKVANFIETITNASLLNPEYNRRIICSGIDRIRISVEAVNGEGYSTVTGKEIDFDSFINNIRDLHDISGECEIYCKIVDISVPTKKERDKFYEIFDPICDRMFIDTVIPLWSDFDEISEIVSENATGIHNQKVKEVRICPYPFYSLMINPDGEVTLCCADWKREYIVGDLKRESLINIWNGNKLRAFWINMLKGKKDEYIMCSKCKLPSYDCNDDIDEFGSTILARLEE